MGLRRFAYGDLWGSCGCGLGLMGQTYGLFLLMGLRWFAFGDLWGSCGCGLVPMGDLWPAVAAVPALWGESMGLYVSGMWSDVVYVWDCGARSMGIYGVALAAVWDPWD